MPRFPRVALIVLVTTIAVAACRRPPQPPPGPTPEEIAARDSVAREQARQDSIAAAERARQDSIAAVERARQDSIAAVERRLSEARNTLTAMVYFDFDQSDLSPASQATLDAKIPLLQANSEMRIRVAGHADERGSDEYNLALGQRRAAAAKRYLVQQGIDASRIETVSFGEERPAVQGSDESAWSQNRRDEFEIIAGGENISVPQQ